MIYTLAPQSLKSILISLDSRQIYDAPNTAFFAVRGIHHDGHQYIENLYKSGFKEFINYQCGTIGGLDLIKKLDQSDLPFELHIYGRCQSLGFKNYKGELPDQAKDDAVFPYKYHSHRTFADTDLANNL